MPRRAFLVRPRAVELSCERLYMKYEDARSEGRLDEFLQGLAAELAQGGRVHLTDTAWLARDDFRAAIGPLLSAATRD